MHIQRTILSVGVVLGLIFLALLVSAPTQNESAGQEKATARKRQPRRESRPVPMLANAVALEISLGLKDQQPTRWDSEVQVSGGRFLDMQIVRGGPNAIVEGARFRGRSVRRMIMQRQEIVGPIIRATFDAPLSATVSVRTEQGEFSFKISDVPDDGPKTFLDGAASVTREPGATRLTGRGTEDDFPAMVKGPDGTIWLAYVEYQPGPPIVQERLAARDFSGLVPQGHGDQIRLARFDGKVWQPPIDVSEAGLDIWRPTIAVDGKGDVWVSWSQQIDGDWELFTRHYTPPPPPSQGGDSRNGKWSDISRLTQSPGADFHAVAAADSAGTVWLAWQAWRDGQFDIMLLALKDGRDPKVVSNSKANDWNPAIAADSRGNVFVAWDTYDRGNYDVRLCALASDGRQPPGNPKVMSVADSARFEARPALACDAQNRLWIAYEEGEEQWGKDFSNEQFRRIPLEKSPGSALYNRRTVVVKCLQDGKLMQPAGDLQQVFDEKLKRKQSIPRLAVDASSNLWLLVRHHPLPLGQGETWHSFALRYDGQQWSSPRRLPNSSNLIDNRPALVPFEKGLLAVYSSDSRVRTQERDQDDLFAFVLAAGERRGSSPSLIDDKPAAAAERPAVHPDETADITRMAEYRVDSAGKKLRLLRGEFHRHTEFTSHGDVDGLLEDSWRYALDAARLDWMGNGDHANGFFHEYMWWLIQKTTDIYHHPPTFVAAQTYERSLVYPNGHRNVMFPRRGIRPLPQGNIEGTPEKGTPDTKRLYAYLKHFGGICAVHTSATNMGTDWRDNDPEVEPIVEIYQGLRHNYEHAGAPRAPTAETHIGGYQPAGYVWNALEKGYRLGFQSSSDHISTHISYAVALVEDVSRQGIIDAFKKRQCYAATDNIILDVRSGEHVMGDAFETKSRPTLEIKVHGTRPIAKLHVIRNNKYVYSTEPKSREVKLRYTDMDPQSGKASYYYVRVEQDDGNLAWGSPMWITYKP